jgi:hypothetical protein
MVNVTFSPQSKSVRLKPTMRTTVLCTSLSLICGLVIAHAQGGPSPVIRVYVEQVKPGKNAAHTKAESGFARTFAKANYPAHYFALDSMAGSNEAWFVEGHDSFAGMEHAEKAGDAEPLKAELEQVSATDGEYLSSTRSMIGVFRPDLSYEPEGSPTLSKTRYMAVITIRIKMGTEQRLASAVSELVKVYKNVAMPQATLVYQVISGTPAGTFLIFEPMTTLAAWDQYPAIMQSLKQAGGRKFEALQRDLAEINSFEETRLMSINPRTSYVSKETLAGDPDFWAPKPKPVAAPKKGAPARHTGQ